LEKCQKLENSPDIFGDPIDLKFSGYASWATDMHPRKWFGEKKRVREESRK